MSFETAVPYYADDYYAVGIVHGVDSPAMETITEPGRYKVYYHSSANSSNTVGPVTAKHKSTVSFNGGAVSLLVEEGYPTAADVAIGMLDFTGEINFTVSEAIPMTAGLRFTRLGVAGQSYIIRAHIERVG